MLALWRDRNSIPCNEQLCQHKHERKYQFAKKCNWYDLNLKICIATLVSGLGATNLSELFSFIGIPKSKVLHKRVMPVCECQIGGS